MRLLVVGNRVPWPLHDGGAIATYGMLRSLAECGVDLHFFSYNTKKHRVDASIAKEKLAFCRIYLQDLDVSVKPLAAVLNIFSGKSYHLQRYENAVAFDALEALLLTNNFDCVMLEGLYSMPFIHTIRKVRPALKVVYRSHNIESQIWKRLADSTPFGFKKWYISLQANRLMRYEEAGWLLVDAVIPIAKSDAAVMRLKNSQIKIELYKPGLAIERPFSFIHHPKSLFHIGSMEWQANEQGVLWFLQKVWPKILLEMPDAQFHFGGKSLRKNDTRFFQIGVINHGEVEDAEAFMQNSGVMIVPIQAGSGIRMKTLEAMALGVSVVSTSIGAQGLGVHNGEQIYIADTPQKFADAVLIAMKSPIISQDMALKARNYVEMHHNLKRNTEALLLFLTQFKV